jgi:hypothetical protein
VGINKPREQAGAHQIYDANLGRKLFLLEPPFVINVGNFAVFDVNGTIFHHRETGVDGGIVQTNSVAIHGRALLKNYLMAVIVSYRERFVKSYCFFMAKSSGGRQRH